MDIFTNFQLHPGQGQLIKQFYSDGYDTVFLAFAPFFKISNENFSNEGRQRSHSISIEEVRQENELLRSMPEIAANIYSYRNNDYPDDAIIFQNAVPVSWKEIIEGAGFNGPEDVNKALKSSIGAYKPAFQRMDLVKKLSDYTQSNKIFYPTEGHFEVLSKIEMLKAFKLFGKTKLIIEEELRQDKKELDISSITEKDFVSSVTFKDYFIYDLEKELLFAVDWDDFFFLICSDKKNIDRVLSSLNFEGFYCNEQTSTSWEWTQSELDKGSALH